MVAVYNKSSSLALEAVDSEGGALGGYLWVKSLTISVQKRVLYNQKFKLCCE